MFTRNVTTIAPAEQLRLPDYRVNILQNVGLKKG